MIATFLFFFITAMQCLVITGLRDGELIHGDNFNLFAAMSALEVFLHLILDQS